MKATWEPEKAHMQKLVASKDAVLQNPTPMSVGQLCEDLCRAELAGEAVRLSLEMVRREPDNVAYLLVAAFVLSTHVFRYDIAAALLRKAMLLEPDNPAIKILLAQALIVNGDLAGGTALFSDIIKLYPSQRVAATVQISQVFLRMGYPMEALNILLFAVQQEPGQPALYNAVGCALGCLNRAEEALPWYEQALHMAPHDEGIQLGAAIATLKAGHYARGWELFALRPHKLTSVTKWFGQFPRLQPDNDVAGKTVVLFQEQGLGDTLQFIRFAPVLVARGARVTVAVGGSLVRLISQSYPDLTVRDAVQFGLDESFDYALPIPNLPHVTRMQSVADIPGTVPYLRADPQDVARFAALLPAAGPRIGLVWSGERRTSAQDVMANQLRSSTLPVMAGALTPVDATLVSLQLGSPREDMAGWHGQPVCDLMDSVTDMADTAAIIASLDLVISVDTSVLHLAGALGRPVWLLSRWDACWRWLDKGETTAWYPTMRIFRPQERSFAPVLRQMGEALQTWVATWHATHPTP
ncbi:MULTISPECIES: tetratricopeptide repeat protein [Acetobacter]|uniref:tetratricopeptide repeat protein n=1 Tax=Acetobacter TaxID=434 RepID=UPI0037700B61